MEEKRHNMRRLQGLIKITEGKQRVSSSHSRFNRTFYNCFVSQVFILLNDRIQAIENTLHKDAESFSSGKIKYCPDKNKRACLCQNLLRLNGVIEGVKAPSDGNLQY